MSIANSNSPFRRPGFLIAAAVLVVIALLAVIAVVSGLFAGNDGNASSPTPGPSAAAPDVAPAADPSVCGLAGYETTSSLVTAPKNEWELVGTVAAPTDPDVGPGVLEENNFRYCYAHTAEGALFAVANYQALASDSRNFAERSKLFVPGPGLDAAMADAASRADDPAPSTRLQIAGFKVNSYNGNEATIDLALSITTSGGSLVSFPTVVQWTDGDWKIVLADDGKLPITPAPLTSLGGYIPWAGV